MKEIELIKYDSFEQENHFYPKALNSQLHSMVSHFFSLDHYNDKKADLAIG
jgi:hypothetical protein